jgi:hypothetical protein
MPRITHSSRMVLVSTVAAVAALWAPACTPKTRPDHDATARLRTRAGAPPRRIPLALEVDRGSAPLGGPEAPAPGEIVSLGVPFPPGALRSTARLRVLDSAGAEVPAHVASLATWPRDGSQRSVLVAFRAGPAAGLPLTAGSRTRWSIEYGGAPGQRTEPMDARPDGPVVASLPPAWYARSRVIGPQVPAAQNRAFAAWEAEIERSLVGMQPPWRSYGRSCERTATERSYYDAPHALFQRFIRHGTAESYRRAREETLWYRQNNLAWYEDGQVAIYSCSQPWDPAKPLSWAVLRNMLAQGMLDDYLLTGDPEAARALRGLGEAYLRNLPALSTGTEVTLTVTERNLAWPMMGLASYYALEQRPEIAQALDQLVAMAVAWQEAGTSGGFEHDLHRPDPDECGRGPRGGSPFMTSLLIDGLMDTWFLTRDERIPPVVLRAAAWYRDHAFDATHTAFLYLWGCEDRDYGQEDWSYLNLLIVHVFGAAHHLSRDPAWLDLGDLIARSGLARMDATKPKEWSQAMRSFSKYMGYRARTRAP